MKKLLIVLSLILLIPVSSAQVGPDDFSIYNKKGGDFIFSIKDGGLVKEVLKIQPDGQIFKSGGVPLEGGSGGSGAQNLLPNSNFETDASGYTASGSSTITRTTTPGEIINGTASGKWTTTTSGETLLVNPVLVATGTRLAGKKCMAKIEYQFFGGTQGHILIRPELDDGSPLSEDIALAPTAAGKTEPAFFLIDCPINDSLQMELETTANAADFIIDEVHVGEPIGQYLVQKEETTKWESCAPTVTHTNATVTAVCRRHKQDLQMRGAIDYTGTPAAAILFITLPNGLTVTNDVGAATYEDHYGNGSLFATTNAKREVYIGYRNANQLSFLYEDGDTVSVDNAELVSESAPFALGTGDRLSFRISVPVDEYANEGGTTRIQSVGAEKVQIYATVTETVQNSINLITGVVNTVNSPAEIADADLVMSVIEGQEFQPLIGCTGTDENSGAGCPGNEAIAFSFVSPTVQEDAEVCIDFSYGMAVNTGTLIFTSRVVKTPNNAQTILASSISQEAGAFVPGGGLVGNRGYTGNKTVCGIFNLSAGKNTFRLFYEVNSNAANTFDIKTGMQSSHNNSQVAFRVNTGKSQGQIVLPKSYGDYAAASSPSSNVTLTDVDEYIQVLNPSTDIDVNLPANVAKAFRIINESTNDITIKSSNGDTLETIATGYVEAIAKSATPTTGSDWAIADMEEKVSFSPSGGNRFSGTTWDMYYVRKNDVVTLYWDDLDAASPGTNGNDFFIGSGALPVRARPALSFIHNIFTDDSLGSVISFMIIESDGGLQVRNGIGINGWNNSSTASVFGGSVTYKGN